MECCDPLCRFSLTNENIAADDSPPVSTVRRQMREAFSMRVRCSFTFSETKTVNWYGLATRDHGTHGMVIILSVTGEEVPLMPSVKHSWKIPQQFHDFPPKKGASQPCWMTAGHPAAHDTCPACPTQSPSARAHPEGGFFPHPCGR